MALGWMDTRYAAAVSAAAAGGVVGYGLVILPGAADKTVATVFLVLGLVGLSAGIIEMLARRERSGRLRERLRALESRHAVFAPEKPLPGGDDLAMISGGVEALSAQVEYLLCIGKGYVNLLDAVPDPVFSVDDDFSILHANEAMAAMTEVDIRKIKGRKCHDIFANEACHTENCPISQARKLESQFEAGVINVDKGGRRLVVKPVGDVLYDCHGDKIGHLVVAKNVTRLVDQERALEEKLEDLRRLGVRINEAARDLAAASDEVSGQVEDAARRADYQLERAAAAARSVERVNDSVRKVGEGADEASRSAEQARDKAREGADVVREVVASIDALEKGVVSLNERMVEMGHQAKGIDKIMTVINDIADQTNLLALNAAIEAARAGEHGRGFAIVADEVRKLAEKTMGATKEVEASVAAMRDATNESVKQSQFAADDIITVNELAGSSGELLGDIVTLAESNAAQVRAISQAAEEQSEASEGITSSVEDMNQASRETADGMGRASRGITEMNELVRRLEALARGEFSGKNKK